MVVIFYEDGLVGGGERGEGGQFFVEGVVGGRRVVIFGGGQKLIFQEGNI